MAFSMMQSEVISWVYRSGYNGLRFLYKIKKH